MTPLLNSTLESLLTHDSVDYQSLYKVYIGLEKEKSGKISAIEIIDGWIKSNECLFLKYQTLLKGGIAYLEAEIVPSKQMNTYLKVQVEEPVYHSILVKTFRQGVCVGYQWTDVDGNVLGLPKRDVQISQPFEVNF